MELLGVHDDNIVNVHDISANQYAIEIKQFSKYFVFNIFFRSPFYGN